MRRPPLQPPTGDELRALEHLGLVEAEQSDAHRCLRWRALSHDGGILYASHVPIPWGAYFRMEDGFCHIVWSCDLATVAQVLWRCGRRVS